MTLKELRKEKLEKCYEYFYKLAEELKETHEIVGSCNADGSIYLIPKGSIEDLTYYGKPKNSYRVSDHWNWHSNLYKCSDPFYVQCYTKDMPRAKMRNDGKNGHLGSNPIFGSMVAYYGDDNSYHNIYGEYFDKTTKTWLWKGEEN
jgi:hypothetical protein